MAKSAKDYEREFGAKPAPGVALTAVVEREQVVNALGHIEHIQTGSSMKRLLPAATLLSTNDLHPLAGKGGFQARRPASTSGPAS